MNLSNEITFRRRNLVKRNAWQLQLHTKLMFSSSTIPVINVILWRFAY